MEFSLKGGVLIIGSLFWQDDLNPGDNIRKNWRDSRLDKSSSINVKVPIRYGRLSTEGGEIYTMIFDNKLKAKDFGNAKLVPFQKSQFQSFSEMKIDVEKLSQAEGQGKQFIKGSRNDTAAWCVCSILFNSKVSKQTKNEILDLWSKEFEKNRVGYEVFSSDFEKYSVKKNGELDIPWPIEASGFDFLIATSTRPKQQNEIPEEEIARHIKNRPYFHPNIQYGISTYQDIDILDHQKTRIRACIENYEKLLLASQKQSVEFRKFWSNKFPSDAGLYVIYEKRKLAYFGETGNIMGRMKDLRRTVNHSFRRSLGYKLFREKATSKKRFSVSNEKKLNRYFEKYISIGCLIVPFGRLEIEEYLVDKYADKIYNKKIKRK